MTYVQKARLTFLGIDDELKNDTTSVYTTNLNSSLFPIPTAITATMKVNNMGFKLSHLHNEPIQNECDFHSMEH
jgi:hypothetical protein